MIYITQFLRRDSVIYQKVSIGKKQINYVSFKFLYYSIKVLKQHL